MKGDMAMVDITLTDPDDLTPDEEARLKYLLALEGKDFDAEVRKYVAAPTESEQAVFRHPELVELTNNSLDRLIASAQSRQQHARQQRDQRQKVLMIDDQLKKLGRERRAIGSYVNLALSEAARNTPRARAERILGRLMYPDLKKIIRDLEAGCSEKDAERLARERLKATP